MDKESELIWEAYILNEQSSDTAPWIRQLYGAVEQIAGNAARSNSLRLFINSFARPEYLIDDINKAEAAARSQDNVYLQNWPNVMYVNAAAAIENISRLQSAGSSAERSLEENYNELKKLVPDATQLRLKLSEFFSDLKRLDLRRQQREFQKSKAERTAAEQDI